MAGHRASRSFPLFFALNVVLCFNLSGSAQVPQDGHTAKQESAVPQPVSDANTSASGSTIPAGVPIAVRSTRTTGLAQGQAIEGTLIDPVYVYDQLVLPAGSIVRGTVSGTTPVHGIPRAKALLNGDITPLKMPLVRFDRVLTPSGERTLVAEGTQRDIKPVRFVASGKRPSLISQGKSMAKERINSTKEAVFGPGKKDRALRLLYSQLPYHPQRVWAGTTFVADVTSSAEFPNDGAPKPVLTPSDTADLNNVHVLARLTEQVSSDTSKKGDTVDAVVTQPVFDPQHRLLLGEGSHLTGRIVSAKPSRSLGRNGSLRFVFQQVQRPAEEPQKAFGVLQGAAGISQQNLTVDSEGGVKANPDKNRFVAPLLLGVLAAAGHDRDRDGGEAGSLGRTTVASNGFGLVARVIALTVNDRNVATGFGAYAFAKSIYFRFLVRGQPVMFEKDTPLEVQLQTR